MKKLIVLIILSLSLTVWAKPPTLDITLQNTTNSKVVVRMKSIDHNVKVNGRLWPHPTTVCVAELKPRKDFVLSTRAHNQPPYRYFVSWDIYDNHWHIIKTIKYVVKIPPKYTNALITPEKITLW